jgi:hypothetical protein
MYRTLCRGEPTPLDAAVAQSLPKMPCKLHTYGLAHLRYAPVAVEQVYGGRQDIKVSRRGFCCMQCTRFNVGRGGFLKGFQEFVVAGRMRPLDCASFSANQALHCRGCW